VFIAPINSRSSVLGIKLLITDKNFLFDVYHDEIPSTSARCVNPCFTELASYSLTLNKYTDLTLIHKMTFLTTVIYILNISQQIFFQHYVPVLFSISVLNIQKLGKDEPHTPLTVVAGIHRFTAGDRSYRLPTFNFLRLRAPLL
jgi:hypothetical protein